MHYEIQHRIETLAQIAMSHNSETSAFFSDGVCFFHWDKNFLKESKFWLAKGTIEASSLHDAETSFRNKLTRLISKIALIAQCCIEFTTQPLMIKRDDRNIAFVRYFRDSQGVGLTFGEEERKALGLLLEDNKIPEAFYYYWNDAVNSIGYSLKLLLLCAALDAMAKAGLSRGDKKYKEKFY